MNLFHSLAERFLLLSQSLLLLAECFLLFAEFFLGRPEFLGAIDRGLVANDVGLLVALEPDEISRNLLSELLDMTRIFTGARHGERIGVAGNNHEALFVVITEGVRVAMFVRLSRPGGHWGNRRNGPTGAIGATGPIL